MAMIRTLASLALFTYAGCARCSDEPAVPFKLRPPPAELPKPTAALSDAAAGFGVTHSYAAATDRPEVGAHKLELAGVRALYEADLDRDGDGDVLALSTDDSQRMQLWVATRLPDGFDGARSIHGFSGLEPQGCTLGETSFLPLSESKAALRVELACPVGGSHTGAVSSLWLLSLEATPRVIERIDVLAAGPDGAPTLALLPRSVDSDHDGHDDVVLRVSSRGAAEADALELPFLDRPSGLVRDVREPEATLSAWAASAQSQLAKQPEQATQRAELGLQLARAVCRELGAPALALSGAPGVPCGALPSTHSLSATSIAAYAKRGDTRAAFEHYRNLRRAEPRVSDKLLAQAEAALQKLPAEGGVTLRRGPAVEPLTQPRIHLPSARFVSDAELYLRRVSPVLWNLDSGEESAAPGRSDPLLRDPSGLLIASAMERTCEGLIVRIERAPPPGSDYTNAAPVASPLLVPAASTPGCTRASHRLDDAGFSVLGWAPQGLLAVRGSEVRLLPLASNGRASGEVRILPPEAPRPAPLPSGMATRDGSRYVEATPAGVLLYGPSSTRVELLRPEGYAAVARGPLEVAVSPSARRVAVVAGGNVYVLERTAVR